MGIQLSDDGAYFYVLEPDAGRHAPERQRLATKDGRVVTRRRHGYAARVWVDASPELPVASWLRAAAAVGFAVERLPSALERPVRVRLAGADQVLSPYTVELDGQRLASEPTHHAVNARVRELIEAAPPAIAPLPRAAPGPPARRVLFFESLMNSDMPHNDCELSQGVLHMASTLADSETEVVLANVKMAITGSERPVVGLDGLERALAAGPIDLICITLLEGYYEGVVRLIAELRRLGCRAHVAVGGVMPTLTPEHVAAHLPDVTFVCRGAGEGFVSKLAAILGDASDIDTPLSEAQRAALLALDGLITIDRAGHALLAAHPGHVVSVESLDRVPLDLRLIEARHLEQGVELSTSRGCIHKCAFCSIIGRQSYSARSAEGVFELLERYRERYAELFGEDVPNNAYRLHISDDDFACDRQRARDFFLRLLQTPFRLSSVQVSIADLCAKSGKQLLPRVDAELMSALTAECFADAGAALPERDFVLDHKSRRWSAYLQIGVETFSERELDRLGKGYGLAHVRAVVDALAERHIHMDAYLILANVDTTPEDLVDSVEELCRLKLRHPKWFHIRFPIVPRLVSYFPSASHRRMLRRGQAHAFRLRAHAQIERHPEFDYPFVDADEPEHPWIQSVDVALFSDRGFYTQTLENLREHFVRAAQDTAELPAEAERLLRRLDDRPRRLAFAALSEARDAVQAPDAAPATATAERQALETTEALLGPTEDWLGAFRRYVAQTPSRLVVIPTWQCELRCVYCYIPKQGGRVMPARTLERSVDLLLSTDRQRALLQFFGGEALMEYDLVRRGIEYGMERAARTGKELRFVLSSNGWSLDDDKLEWLRGLPVKLELSLDGTPDVQNLARPAHERGVDSYENGIAPRATAILDSGLAHDVIMVVLPHNVAQMPENFFHIASLGFKRIQINFALGVNWRPEHKRSFAEGLFSIGRELRRRWTAGDPLYLVNLDAGPYPVRLNGEITVDYDGTIYGGNGFLHENEHKQKMVLGHLDDCRAFDRYTLDGPDNETLLEWGYPPGVTANNRELGKIMTSFVRYMHQQGDVGTAQRVEAHA